VEEVYVTTLADLVAVLRAGGTVAGAPVDQPPAVPDLMDGVAVAVVVVVLLSTIPVAEVVVVVAVAEVAVLELLQPMVIPAVLVMQEQRQTPQQ